MKQRPISRVIIIVADGLGVGALPDAGVFGDDGCNTLGRLAESADGLSLPNLENLGLGQLGPFSGIRMTSQPEGCFGKIAFTTKAKDSLHGHWELAGLVVTDAPRQWNGDIPPSVLDVVRSTCGRRTLGNRVEQGLALVEASLVEHRRTGAPIVWGDQIGVLHVAAHEGTMRSEDLYKLCREVRKRATESGGVSRVVAHPLKDGVSRQSWGHGRKHFAGEPPGDTLLDGLIRAGQLVMAVGKIDDLFGGRGVTRSSSAEAPGSALDQLENLLKKVPRGLLWANMDVVGPDEATTTAALQEFDRGLPNLMAMLRPTDLLCLTSDHGFDLSRPTPTHSREYAPLLVYGPKLARGVNLGVRSTAADVGQTIAEALGAERLSHGESFLAALRAG
jgi:phosphopentomutase